MDLFCTITFALAVWQGWSSLGEKAEETAKAIREILVTGEEDRGTNAAPKPPLLDYNVPQTDPVFPIPIYSSRPEDGGFYYECISYWQPSPAQQSQSGAVRDHPITYWPFPGPLHQGSESGPMPGAAFDWYSYLPAPAIRKDQYTVMAFNPLHLAREPVGTAAGDGSILLEEPPLLNLLAPTLPPSLPLVMTDLAPLKPPRWVMWGSEEMWGDVLDFVDPRVQQLTHADERVRYHAAMQLGQAGNRYAVDALRATLAGDPSAAVREAAARSLAKLGGVGEISALRRAAFVDSDEDVQRIAAFAAEMIEGRCGFTVADIPPPKPAPFQFPGGFFN